MIEQYNDEKPPPGPNNLMLAVGRNIKLQGLLIPDHMGILPDFFRDVPQWIAQGKMKWRETVVNGLENAPKAFVGLFRGENIGKMLVKISEK